jgi:AbrB family looped-hinge helix DNA binding protein
MKITSKGQVTIPQDVRERHGMLPGTEVRFVDDGDAVRLVKAEGQQRRGRALVERMRGRAQTRLTTDEIMALTRGEK